MLNQNQLKEIYTRPDDLKHVKARLLKRLIQKCRSDFYTFLKFMAPTILPEGKFVNGRHIKLICKELQKLEQGDIKNLMIFMPPGSMKTVSAMLFQAWYLGRHDGHKIIAVGHTSDFAEKKFGMFVKDIIKKPQYQEIFPNVKLRNDSTANKEWRATNGSIYKTAGATQAIAGERGNLGYLDDVLSEQTAYSKTTRDEINNWYGPGFRSRLLPNAKQLIIMTRWHPEDLAGFLLEQQRTIDKAQKWTVISIPAILDYEGANLLGLPQGGSYWPEYWPLEHFESIMSTEVPAKFAALYLQQPTMEEGNLFKIDDIQIWEKDEPPRDGLVEIIMTMDTALSEKTTADYSVIGIWGVVKMKEIDKKGREVIVPHILCLGIQRGRWDFPTLREKTLAAYKKHRPDWVIIEKKQSGMSLLQELRTSDLPLEEFIPDKDKISRAHAVTNIVSQGRVWLPAPTFEHPREWLEPFMDELKQFPNGNHDDQVDAFVMALLHLRNRYAIELSTDWTAEFEDNPKPKRKLYWR